MRERFCPYFGESPGPLLDNFDALLGAPRGPGGWCIPLPGAFFLSLRLPLDNREGKKYICLYLFKLHYRKGGCMPKRRPRREEKQAGLGVLDRAGYGIPERRPRKEEKYKMTLSLARDVIEALKIRAAQERRTVSGIIEEWVRSWKEVKK